MKISDVVVRKVVLSSFQENAYIVRLKESVDCVVIDPGMDPAPLISFLHSNHLNPKALLITHGHWDHIGGITDVKANWPDAQVVIGIGEQSKLTNPDHNLSSAFGFPMTTSVADKTVKDNEIIEVADLKFRSLETPGHSSGHVVFILEAEDAPIVFSGDLLFAGSIGRTDFFDGNAFDLLQSIKSKLLPLPGQTTVCPGHGPSTTIQYEQQYNPYLQ